jgi:fatty-acyl-CoA synthase
VAVPDTPQTLFERVIQAAARPTGVTFVTGDAAVRCTWAELHRDARAVAAGLQARGVGPGSHVALLGPTTRPLVTTIQAVWLTGATLVLLPLPMRLASIEEFVAQTRARLHHADVTHLLLDADLAPFLEARPDDPVTALVGSIDGDPDAYVRPPGDPDALAVLQFTSGSTAEPKGVMLPNRAICANLDAVALGAGLDADDDVMVSWLPLYHDMGLVGFLMLPMSTGTELVLAAPQDFLASPLRWMRWLSDHGGTATAGPNFSYVLATRALRTATETLDLSRLRIALNGAEPVDPDSVDAFVEAGARHGLRPGAVFPAFGMAEIVIGGSFPVPMSGLRVDRVDRRALETEQLAVPADEDDPGARRFARLGRPLAGLRFRVVDPVDGRELGEREVGELQIHGTSVTPGYYGRPGEGIVDGGWLATGDLGYLVDGELVLCGRIKDVIIIGGRNVYPDEIERAVGSVPGVRAGNVIAFGVEGRHGKEGVVVVAEARPEGQGEGEQAVAELRREITSRVRAVAGVPAREIVLVAPGSLPKTSSGKLQRSRCRQDYLDDRLLTVHA